MTNNPREDGLLEWVKGREAAAREAVRKAKSSEVEDFYGVMADTFWEVANEVKRRGPVVELGGLSPSRDSWFAPDCAIDAAWRAIEDLEDHPPVHRNALGLAVSAALLALQQQSGARESRGPLLDVGEVRESGEEALRVGRDLRDQLWAVAKQLGASEESTKLKQIATQVADFGAEISREFTQPEGGGDGIGAGTVARPGLEEESGPHECTGCGFTVCHARDCPTIRVALESLEESGPETSTTRCDICERALRPGEEAFKDWEGAIFCDCCAADHGIEAGVAEAVSFTVPPLSTQPSLPVEEGGYACPDCGRRFASLGAPCRHSDHVTFYATTVLPCEKAAEEGGE